MENRNKSKLWLNIAMVAFIGFIVSACDDGANEKYPATCVHQFSEWTITTAATCKTEGAETRECAHDSTHKETRKIPIDRDFHIWSKWDVVIEATCEAEGEGTRKCNLCSKEDTNNIIPIDSNVHDWVYLDGKAPTCTTDGSGTRKCNICDKEETHDNIPALEHDFNDWTVITPATCTEAGEETGTCSRDSSHTIKRIIVAIGGWHQYEWAIIQKATCQVEGFQGLRCTICGFFDDTFPFSGYCQYKWYIVQEATCEIEGTREWKCETCNASNGVESYMGHECEYLIIKEATCEADGSREYKCILCNFSLFTESYSSHTYDWVIVNKAVCYKGEYRCTTCGFVGSASGAVLHEYEWISIENGTCEQEYKCKVCSFVEYIFANHELEWGKVQEATCETETLYGNKCKLCGHIGTTYPSGNALGHDYGNWVVTTPATCTTTGLETGTCSRDSSHKNIRPANALGHDWEISVTTATFITEGETTMRCKHDASHLKSLDYGLLPIENTTDWTTALSQLNGKTGSYSLNISGNIAVAGSTANTFGTTSSGSLNVTLKGSGKLYLTSRGNLLRIDTNQKLIIDSEHLILQGLTNGQNGATQDNNTSLILVNNGEVELMNGYITGNVNAVVSGVNNSGYGGGVFILNNGSFVIYNGEIYGNTSTSSLTVGTIGGGVYVDQGGTLIMHGGKINKNNCLSSTFYTYGGGVYVKQGGTLVINNGEISGNTASSSVYNSNGPSYGGGVYNLGTIIMNNGNIIDNYCSNRTNDIECGGGGVYNQGTFTMNDGEISGNTTSSWYNTYGGGVYVKQGGTFTLNNGKISSNLSYNRDGTGTGTPRYGYGSGVSIANAGTFTMHGGEISGNAAEYGGGIHNNGSNIRIINGVIYGTNESNAALRNDLFIDSGYKPSAGVVGGAVLFRQGTGGTTQYGTFTGETWNGTNIPLTTNGSNAYTNNTIRVINGVLQ